MILNLCLFLLLGIFISSDVAVMSDGSVHVLNTMIYFRNELKVSIFYALLREAVRLLSILV